MLKLTVLYFSFWTVNSVINSEDFELVLCPSSISKFDTIKCSEYKKPDTELKKLSEQVPIKQHAIVKVNETCYDWTDDDIVNNLNCSDEHFQCCLKHGKTIQKGPTVCSGEILCFLRTWNIMGFKYQLWGFDNRRFADILVRFITACV